MAKEEKLLTPEGAKKIREELAQLTGPARTDLAARLRSAIQQGDLSENADYIKAKEDQAFLEGRILELEALIRNATIVDPSTTSREVVSIGCSVTVVEDGEEPEIFYLVGSKEADPRKRRISHESPIGKALMGHAPGDTIHVDSPSGRITFRIVKIE
jgi:transcription elongation factor GreA